MQPGPGDVFFANLEGWNCAFRSREVGKHPEVRAKVEERNGPHRDMQGSPGSSIPWTLFSYEFCFIPQVPLNASSPGRFVCSCGLGQEDGICQMVLYSFQISFRVLIRF